jgi:preprotein translocase subunit Sec63
MNLVKAHEVLTNKEKFNNWQLYGDPDGSKAMKMMEIALPSFLVSSEHKATVLLAFLVGFICLPLLLVICK